MFGGLGYGRGDLYDEGYRPTPAGWVRDPWRVEQDKERERQIERASRARKVRKTKLMEPLPLKKPEDKPLESTPQLSAYVGQPENDKPSNRGDREWVERLYSLDNELFGLNYEAGRVLIRIPENDSRYDHYAGMPFTKGVTERETGKTMLLAGTSAHHIDAMVGQFEGVSQEGDEKSYGDTMRWFKVGDLETGFIGLDYNPEAASDGGVARSRDDVAFLAETLIDFGFDEKSRLFLLKPPHIIESSYGIEMRKDGLEKLIDYAKLIR